jgi:outer membrane protein
MKFYKKIIFILPILVLTSQNLLADLPKYLDFNYVLNESTAGSKAQKSLKNMFQKTMNELNDKEKNLLNEEKELIKKKRIISEEEYKNKIKELRKKVIDLRKLKNESLSDLTKKRTNARNTLLKNLNPILKQYMQDKQIRMVIDKKDLILADEKLDITDDIIKILNDKLKSIKLN